MPASEAQIRANQANAARSSGPKSEAGKARSRLNATTHGLTSQLPDVEATLSPEFEDRRARWGAEHQPVGEAGGWAMDRVVAASFRIERSEQAIDQIFTDVQERARLAWDEDRAVEAASIFARLSKVPMLASRQLQTTWAGVVLLIEAWLGLVASLEKADWSELEASRALDLLGVDPDFRSARTLIDVRDGSDPVAFRKSLALGEIERLEDLRDNAMAPLDDLGRRQAMAGGSALLSKQAKLVLRYERDAWKHYWDGMKELKAQAQPPIPVPTPTPAAPAVVPPARPIVEERRPTPTPTPAQPPPIRREVAERIITVSRENDPDWLDLLSEHPGAFVPISVGSVTSGR